MSEILRTTNVKKYYPFHRPFGVKASVKALDGVSLQINKGKTLAVVGESGCGKSTLAKTILQLEQKTGGDIYFEGSRIEDISDKRYRQSVQMIFQDPYSSLNPRKKVRDIVAEPLVINTSLSRGERDRVVAEKLELVGLRANFAERYPHMFSGGQRQRIGIARALVLNPKLLLCDEPVSALDISIQAQVLNLLLRLQDELDLSYLFISHDLSVVRHIADEVAIMYFGKIVEKGDRLRIFEDPKHPYTKALLSATPHTFEHSSERIVLQGELPSPLRPPRGCAFASRCALKQEQCLAEEPSLEEKHGRTVSCWQV